MDKSEEIPSVAQLSTSTTPTDDESITTSTESDSLDTWTLVTDKNKSKQQQSNTISTSTPITIIKKFSEENKIEDLTQQTDALVEHENQDEIDEAIDTKVEEESNIDDLSDGISIISESESAGRISPQPYLREHLGNLNLKFSAGIENISPLNMPDLSSHTSTSDITLPSTANFPEYQNLRQRRPKRTISASGKALQHTDNDNNVIVEAGAYNLHPLVRRGLKSLFYVCVILALLAFIGKLRNPEWNPFADHKQLSELEQKLADMELQNNLMRAEIDILSKQVNYLSDIDNNDRAKRGGNDHFNKDDKYQKHIKRAGEWVMEQKRKAFKAWSGNGDNIESVSITKDDLKQPHKCADDKFVNVAGMCIEKNPPKETLVDTLNKIEDVVVEQIIDGMETIINGGKNAKSAFVKENVAGATEEYKNKKGHMNDWKNTNDVEIDDVDDDDDADAEIEDISDNEREPFEGKNFLNYAKEKLKVHLPLFNKDKTQKQYKKDDSDEVFDKNYHQKRYTKEKPKKYFNKNQSGERFNKVDSDERHYHAAEHESGENSNEHFSKDNSKERFNKAQNKQRSNKETSNESRDRSAEHYRGDNSKERNSKERFNKNQSKERFNRINSKEHLNRDNSKERFNKDYSKERYGSGERKYVGSAERADRNGEWHEKLMQQREKARNQNEIRLNKNWFIERGDSREQMRHR